MAVMSSKSRVSSPPTSIRTDQVRTPAEQAEWEQRYYGCSIADVRNSLDRTVAYIESQRPLGRGANAALVELIDDVMQMIDANELRDAGIYLNRVRLAIDQAASIKLWEGA
jgi:hypothetical protein